jgi:hypothetical protein
MVRVIRYRPTSLGTNDGRSLNPNAIKVVRKSVREIRIRYPENGKLVDGWGLVVRGVGNAGDNLKLDGDGLDPLYCKVSVKGQWAMPAVWLPSGEHLLTVSNVANPYKSSSTNVVISPTLPISVISPRNGETVEAKHLEVTGKACPSRLVCIRLGRKTIAQRTDARGSFRFTDVELPTRGEQRLRFYYAENPDEGAAALVVYWPGLDFPSLVDPVTRAHLKPGADVVRCSDCYTHAYRATWTHMGHCPRCLKATQFWERPNAKFHAPRPDLRGT